MQNFIPSDAGIAIGTLVTDRGEQGSAGLSLPFSVEHKPRIGDDTVQIAPDLGFAYAAQLNGQWKTIFVQMDGARAAPGGRLSKSARATIVYPFDSSADDLVIHDPAPVPPEWMATFADEFETYLNRGELGRRLLEV